MIVSFYRLLINIHDSVGVTWRWCGKRTKKIRLGLEEL